MGRNKPMDSPLAKQHNLKDCPACYSKGTIIYEQCRRCGEIVLNDNIAQNFRVQPALKNNLEVQNNQGLVGQLYTRDRKGSNIDNRKAVL